MEAKDTVLVGCEVICIGEQPTDLVACPLSEEEQEKCQSRRQYESGRQAGLREGVKWIESNHWKSELGGTIHINSRDWQAKLKELKKGG